MPSGSKIMLGKFSFVFLLIACISCLKVNSSKNDLESRIVGGFPINITKAPWQIYIDDFFCGGSIISDRWILTAGHCMANVNSARKVQIRAGSSYFCKGGDLHAVKRIIQHERFNEKTYDYDFSLLELEKPLKFDKTKHPIALHNFNETIHDNDLCLVSGWGSTQNSTESPFQLRGVEVPLVNQKRCKKEYSDFSVHVTPRMICAGYDKGGKDSCSGDSGGPLASFSVVEGEPRLIGVVSWGAGCAVPHRPGVYSRVLAAREWIRNITGV